MTQMSETQAPSIANDDAEPGGYLLDCARQARSLHRMSFDGTDSSVIRLPEGAGTELISRLADEVQHQICQIIPYGAERHATANFDDLVWRGLARRRGPDGAALVEVQRLYLVPSGEQRTGRLLALQAEDEAAGITVFILAVGGGRRPVPMTETWLVDGTVVIRRECAHDQSPVWAVSADRREVERTHRLWCDLLESTGTDDWPAGPDLTADLLRSASITRTMAPMSCTGGYVGHDSCAWYHGVWQYLRLFNMVSSPDWHAGFYRRQLTPRLARQDRPRVLVSGTADYSMLAHVFGASGNRNIDAHVLDLCQTPLLSCRWYAQMQKVRVGLHQLDVSDADCATALLTDGEPAVSGAGAAFDLIVTDAFLTRFTQDALPVVLGTWARLLRPGGAVLTTVRLHGYDQHKPGGVTGEVADFVLRFRKHLMAWRPVLNVDVEQLLDAAHEYALRMTSSHLGGLDDLVRRFAEHGMRVVHHECAEVEGELRRTGYVRLVAEKAKGSQPPG